MPQDTLIAAEHLTRDYGAQRAVDDVSFTLRRGEILGFLGPNGAGKTTTMQILTGVLAPSSGRVMIAGLDLAEQPKAAKAHIGYLPEHPPLYTDLCVDQYLGYCARLRRVPPAGRRDAVALAKRRCGIEDVGARLIGNLSKGYQQRIGIAQAIVHSPAVVILDEPTVGLDPQQIVGIRALIRELGSLHGVILSTHLLSEAQAICDRVLIIHEGRLILDQALTALRDANRAHACIVGLRHPPAASELEALAGVREARALDAQRFHVSYEPGREVPENLAKAAARNGWDLFELAPAGNTLEQTFLQLTRGEAAGPAVERAA